METFFLFILIALTLTHLVEEISAVSCSAAK